MASGVTLYKGQTAAKRSVENGKVGHFHYAALFC